jgi:transcriptional regulator with XRE-family HTH domain
MSAKEPEQRPPTALGQALKIYRDNHKCSQEELAELLNVGPRTVRRWENGETILTDATELKRIADRLGIPYEHLGVAASIYIPITIEQIHSTVDRIWPLIDAGRIREAYIIAQKLVQDAVHHIAGMKDDPLFLHAFARMYHAVAFATALSVRSEEVGQAIYYFQQMEYFARQLKDDTLLAIALTYQGDMQRRKGDLSKAITYLEAARDTTPQADTDARGNALQLLARAYLRVKRVNDFEVAIKGAEELAHVSSQQPARSTGNQYHLAHVYEEYAKSYVNLGKLQQALDYVDLAEKAHPLTKSTEMLLKLARAEVLIYSGDLRNGEPLAVEAAIYTRQHGHYRRLERVHALSRYIKQQVLHYSKVELALDEALEGQIEIR